MQFTEQDYRDLQERYNDLKQLHDMVRNVCKTHRERADKLQELNTKLMLEMNPIRQENQALREEHFADMQKLMKLRTELANAMKEISTLTVELVQLKSIV